MNKRIVCLHGLLIKPSRGSHCSSDEHTQLLAVRQSHPQLLIYLLQSLPSLHSVKWTDFLFFSKGPNFNSSLFLFKIFHYANTHREVTFEGDVRIIFACSTDLEMIFFFYYKQETPCSNSYFSKCIPEGQLQKPDTHVRSC